MVNSTELSMGSLVLSEPFEKLIQIDTIETNLALVPPRLVELEQRVSGVHVFRLVPRQIPIKRLSELVVPPFRELPADLPAAR